MVSTPCLAQSIVAHRGASYSAPENTMAAFRLAWEQDADAVEGDFYLTADQKIVCIHDKTTKRVAPGQPVQTVEQSTLEELQKLDVGRWKHEQFAGERIPTLADVLNSVPDEKGVFIEIKSGPEIVPVLKKQLADSELTNDQITIIAFDRSVVKACRSSMPQYKCNWLSGYKKNEGESNWTPTASDVVAGLVETGATGFGSEAKMNVVDQQLVESVRDAGCGFHVWTVNDSNAAKHFIDLGVDSITTDRPGLIRTLLPQSRRRSKVDWVREIQRQGVHTGTSPAVHWGWKDEIYSQWTTHTNRLIPVYTYGTKRAGNGIDLDDYRNENSLYRDEAKVTRLYGRLTTRTVNPNAEYLDQTDLFEIQRAAIEAGKKHLFLVIFDGMDWQTTRAASIHNQQTVSYHSGRGTGTHFQEYQANGTSQYGFMVTSPHNDGTQINVDQQTVTNPGGTVAGGYDVNRGGPNPWTSGNDLQYLATQPKDAVDRHTYTDSASSAVSMAAGIKTYNGAINIDPNGNQVSTIVHMAQSVGYRVGLVTSVPISHATPASMYAHNVHRNDYQDLTRDLIGRPSISHPEQPLSGVDVLVGGGYGTERNKDSGQGKNFVPGNAYLTDIDLAAVDIKNGGRYVVATRTQGVAGAEGLAKAAEEARKSSQRLLGFYGVGSEKGHLPYQTADGSYNPTLDRQKTKEQYNERDLIENPTLAEMTRAALTVLETNERGFWMMLESGDVDWANHSNNLDNAIGAVNSGDAAVKVITDWVEKNSNWEESLMIVTADHGHYLVLQDPEALIEPVESK